MSDATVVVNDERAKQLAQLLPKFSSHLGGEEGFIFVAGLGENGGLIEVIFINTTPHLVWPLDLLSLICDGQLRQAITQCEIALAQLQQAEQLDAHAVAVLTTAKARFEEVLTARETAQKLAAAEARVAELTDALVNSVPITTLTSVIHSFSPQARQKNIPVIMAACNGSGDAVFRALGENWRAARRRWEKANLAAPAAEPDPLPEPTAMPGEGGDGLPPFMNLDDDNAGGDGDGGATSGIFTMGEPLHPPHLDEEDASGPGGSGLVVVVAPADDAGEGNPLVTVGAGGPDEETVQRWLVDQGLVE